MKSRFRNHFVVGASLLVLLTPNTALTQDGIRLLHQMQQALGGADRLAAIRDYDWRVTAKTWDQAGHPSGEVHRRIRLIRPNDFRMDQQGPYGTVVMYFNGSSGWEITPDGSADLQGSELEFAKREVFGFYLNLWSADRNPGYEIISPSTNVIRITYKPDQLHLGDILVDQKSGLPARTTGTSNYTEVKDWHTVKGVRLPHRILNFHSGGGELKS